MSRLRRKPRASKRSNTDSARVRTALFVNNRFAVPPFPPIGRFPLPEPVSYRPRGPGVVITPVLGFSNGRLYFLSPERVVHTGDITQAKTLEVLARLTAPLVGVYGNNDERDAIAPVAARHAMRLVEGHVSFEAASRRIGVIHNPDHIDDALLAAHDLVLHGHNHRLVLERRGGALLFNPGGCAGFLEGHNAVGVVDLAKLEVELLKF